jgi:hypothetical protein
MNIKYNAALLKKIEEIFKEAGYTVRYERGNFQNGYCVLEKKKVVVINKFHEVEARINSMVEILMTVKDLDLSALSSESTKLYQQLHAERSETLFEQ